MSSPLRARLRQLRLGAGLSQRELCRRMGVDESYVTRLENGQREPSSDVLRRWAEVCGVEVTVLDPASGLPEMVAGLRPVDADRVRRFAEALTHLPAEIPAGPLHPGDIALAVVEAATASVRGQAVRAAELTGVTQQQSVVEARQQQRTFAKQGESLAVRKAPLSRGVGGLHVLSVVGSRSDYADASRRVGQILSAASGSAVTPMLRAGRERCYQKMIRNR